MAPRKTATAGAEPAQEPQDDERPKGPSVDISAPRSYRRAGMQFGPTPVTVYMDELDDKVQEILADDPVLIIRPTRETEE